MSVASNATAIGFAASALGASAEAVVCVDRIKHGLTNRSWLVRTSTDAVVVRISDADEQALRIDRRSEAVILSEVAAAGIGPPVLLCDPAQRVLITRYAGATWSNEDARYERGIRQLAQILRRLHQLEVPAGIARVDLGLTIEGYLHTLDERAVHGGLTVQSLRECAGEVAQQLACNSLTRLCHNDVHHFNVVESDELRLLDWEYAGAGEPLFDLASVCVYHRYDKRRREQLLDAYAPQSGSDTWHRLELACWLFDYVRDLWFAVRESDGNRMVPRLV